MRRKIAILAIVLTSLLLSGCVMNEQAVIEREEKRIGILYRESFVVIYVDTQTGVQYLASSYGGGTCMLVDEDGNPLLYKGNEPLK